MKGKIVKKETTTKTVEVNPVETVQKVEVTKTRKDRMDWVMFICTITVTFIAVLGIPYIVFVQTPEVLNKLQILINATKSYNVSVADVLTTRDQPLITIERTSNVTEIIICHHYPIEEINATLRVCDINTTNLNKGTSNITKELTIEEIR